MYSGTKNALILRTGHEFAMTPGGAVYIQRFQNITKIPVSLPDFRPSKPA
jgi:hypothetical protein